MAADEQRQTVCIGSDIGEEATTIRVARTISMVFEDLDGAADVGERHLEFVADGVGSRDARIAAPNRHFQAIFRIDEGVPAAGARRGTLLPGPAL